MAKRDQDNDHTKSGQIRQRDDDIFAQQENGLERILCKFTMKF